jgi:signal transduction histidine kinase
MEQEENILKTISFKVDAGLIDRLGRELVGRAETAVSELVKNSYDADATVVDVKFINSNEIGGTLKIIDNGLGMSRDELERGFMTISSTDKIHNPKSLRYERSKAGRKGIGRFATHRLGQKLTIITQTKESEKALKLSINWDDYKIDTDLISIKNPIEEIEKTQEEGTELIIDSLREWWSESEIKRIYRYVSDLLQPDYLSDRSRDLKLAKQTDSSFKVKFTQTINEVERVIADPDKMLFEKALAVIEGYVDINNDGYCSVESLSLDLGDNNIIPILYNKETEVEELVNGEKKIVIVKEPKYNKLNNVHFKSYYFIYNREEYYTNISKIELNNILKISSEQGGIKLYRNGFRVLPYGERNNDWLNIDRRYFNESGTNIPFGNHNLFGFVEIIDSKGDLFEETASREGLLENDAYIELRDFVSKSLEAGRNRIRFAVEKIKKEKSKKTSQGNVNNNIIVEKNTIDKLSELEKQVNDLIENKGDEKNNQDYKEKVRNAVRELKLEFQNILDELGMLRVLAGLGLTIGEFTHEVVQFSPSMNGDLSVLGEQRLEIAGINSLENLKRTIKLFTSYTAYFNATVSANVSRELKPQELDRVVNRFKDIIEADLNKLNIELIVDFFGYELITIPMHSSEWSSILFNLYTNSKKAIRRANAIGKIKIIAGKEENKAYLEFLDNGDGIPEENKEKIFEAFFTTSSPVGFDASQDERLTGTGLGLKIVRDIVQTYGGTIEVVKPETNYNTCFRIEIPLVTAKQKEEYGL